MLPLWHEHDGMHATTIPIRAAAQESANRWRDGRAPAHVPAKWTFRAFTPVFAGYGSPIMDMRQVRIYSAFRIKVDHEVIHFGRTCCSQSGAPLFVQVDQTSHRSSRKSTPDCDVCRIRFWTTGVHPGSGSGVGLFAENALTKRAGALIRPRQGRRSQ
jgi:hypothetical protein